MTSANKGFRDPVVPPKVALIGIATTLGVWLIVFGCGQGLRSCGAKNSPVQSDRNENDRRERPAAPPQPAPSRDLVRTITLKPNEWSEWVKPGPSTRWTVDWQSKDGKIEYEVWYRTETQPKQITAEHGKPSDMGTHIDKFRYRLPNGGKVFVTIQPF